MALVVLICLGGVACLTPLAIYLWWVAGLNRRRRPVVVPAAWDFVALLAGLSGFLLFGGGVLVALAQSNARVVFRGNAERFQSAIDAEWRAWAVVASAYLLLMVGGIGLALLVRARGLAVYNIDRGRADAAVDAALADLGIPATRAGDLWSRAGAELVEVRAFDGFRHVTVWLAADDLRLRQDIERAVRGRLASTAGADNPIVPYLSSAATTVGCSAFTFVVMIGYLVYTSYN